MLHKNGLFCINFCRCIIVLRHFNIIFNEISKICINTCVDSKLYTQHFTRIKKFQSAIFNNEYFKMSRQVSLNNDYLIQKMCILSELYCKNCNLFSFQTQKFLILMRLFLSVRISSATKQILCHSEVKENHRRI